MGRGVRNVGPVAPRDGGCAVSETRASASLWRAVMIAGRARGYRGRLLPVPPEQRFWLRIEKTLTCWLWLGAKSHGYGEISIGGRPFRAHRFAYEQLVGPIPNRLI